MDLVDISGQWPVLIITNIKTGFRIVMLSGCQTISSHGCSTATEMNDVTVTSNKMRGFVLEDLSKRISWSSSLTPHLCNLNIYLLRSLVVSYRARKKMPLKGDVWFFNPKNVTIGSSIDQNKKSSSFWSIGHKLPFFNENFSLAIKNSKSKFSRKMSIFWPIGKKGLKNHTSH